MIRKLLRRILRRPEDNARTPAASSGPVSIPREQHGISREQILPAARKVCDGLQAEGYQAYVVGGAVRDLIAGIEPKDFDVATSATPEQVTEVFRRARMIGRRFKIVHVMFGRDVIEVTTFRGDSEAVTDEHGRILHDNVFGTMEEDAARRDFTVNALYYDPTTETVIDFHHGVADLKQKTLRMIGDAPRRYREDPVRMLRAVRLGAKLGLIIDPAAREPIRSMSGLLENVPPARLFDEMLKLLTSGHAVRCVRQLREEGLHHGLLPLLDVVLEQPLGFTFVTLALASTDARVMEGKTVSPGFLFAALLWHQVVEKWNAYRASGEFPIPALHLAADDVLDSQTEKLALQRKIGSDMREIWAMQPRFERRVGKAPYKLLEHPRFRAGLDFFQLRAASGEIEQEAGDWWRDFYEGDGAQREALLAAKPRPEAAGSNPAAQKKRPSRRSRNRGARGDGGHDRGGDSHPQPPAKEGDA